jgi:hypothetical protein
MDPKHNHRSLSWEALKRLKGTRADLNAVEAYIERLEGLLQRQNKWAKEVAVLLPPDSEDDCG